jgi:hypothetical protein
MNGIARELVWAKQRYFPPVNATRGRHTRRQESHMPVAAIRVTIVADLVGSAAQDPLRPGHGLRLDPLSNDSRTTSFFFSTVSLHIFACFGLGEAEVGRQRPPEACGKAEGQGRPGRRRRAKAAAAAARLRAGLRGILARAAPFCACLSQGGK